MSIVSELARIKSSTATIRSKYVELGIAESTDKITDLATASDQIENKGAVTATVPEGTTYTIPKGYHNGSGTVTGVAPPASSVVQKWLNLGMTSNTTPSPYTISLEKQRPAWVSSSFETWSKRLEAYKFFDGDREENAYISNFGDQDAGYTYLVVDFGRPVSIKGHRIYHSSIRGTTMHCDVYQDGTWHVDKLSPFTLHATSNPEENIMTAPVTCSKIRYYGVKDDGSCGALQGFEIEFLIEESLNKYSLQSTKTITPTTQQQAVTPDDGYYGLSGVTIDPIPTNYQDVSVVSATADDVLSGKVILDRTGTLTAGSMANNGDISQEMDGVSNASIAVAAGYCEESAISLDDTIEQALAEI